MDLFDLIRVILARWKVVVPVLLATAALAFAVQSRVPPQFEAVGQLVFETPDLDASNDAGPVIDPVALADDIALEAAGPDREFTVTALGGANYVVSAVASSRDDAVTDAEFVIEQLDQRVQAVQEAQNVLDAEIVELRLISPQITPEELANGSLLAQARFFLYDPVAATVNPYTPDASTGRLLEVAVTSDAGLAEFERRAGSGVEFAVGQQARDAAPLMQVITIGSEVEQVLNAFYVVRDMLVEELRAREERAGVLPSQQLSLVVIDAPLAATDSSPPVNRATVGVIALGGLLALGLALALEGHARRREERAGTSTTRAGDDGERDTGPRADARAGGRESSDLPIGITRPASAHADTTSRDADADDDDETVAGWSRLQPVRRSSRR